MGGGGGGALGGVGMGRVEIERHAHLLALATPATLRLRSNSLLEHLLGDVVGVVIVIQLLNFSQRIIQGVILGKWRKRVGHLCREMINFANLILVILL